MPISLDHSQGLDSFYFSIWICFACMSSFFTFVIILWNDINNILPVFIKLYVWIEFEFTHGSYIYIFFYSNYQWWLASTTIKITWREFVRAATAFFGRIFSSIFCRIFSNSFIRQIFINTLHQNFHIYPKTSGQNTDV